MSASHKPENYQILTSDYSNNCNHLKKCASLERIASVLDTYHNINKTTNTSRKTKKITELLTSYKHLINDYHHILIKHLSHSNHSKNIQNINFINNQIVKCNINTCNDYITHNKNNLQMPHILDKELSFYLKYLSSIHIHFAHSFDAGFRSISYTNTPNTIQSDPKNESVDQEMLNQLLLFNFGDRDDIITAMRCANNKNDANEIIEILKDIHTNREEKLISKLSSSEFYLDEQIIAIKNHIKHKKKFLISLRGHKRWKNNKFSTHIETSTKTSVTVQPRRKSSKVNKLLLQKKEFKLENKYKLAEDDTGTFTVLLNDNLCQNGVACDILDELNEWINNNNFDSDGIIEDIRIAQNKGNNESNLYQFCCLKNQIKCFNGIKQFVNMHLANSIISSTNPRVSSGSEEKRTDPECVNENEMKLNNVKRGSKEYVFGQRYYYWPQYKDNAWYIPCKYSTLKEETLHFMDLNIFNCCYIKAIKLLIESDSLRKLKSNNDGIKLGYDIGDNLPLNIENILSIIFYSDFDVLSYSFKSTFRKITVNESDIAQKSRHSLYCNWSKILTQTVHCWGTQFWFNKIDVLYHNTTFMHYALYTATFNAPTSMTRYLEVAAMYSEPDGVILELSQYPKVRAKYFNCALISCYGYEDELLFMPDDKSMDIVSIRVFKYDQDHKCFIKAMRLFNKVTTATILSTLERYEIIESDYVIIQRLIGNKNNFPSYINESFNRYCLEKKRIKMDIFCLKDKRYYYKYNKLFLHSYHLNLLRFDYICTLFPNIVSIESWDTGIVTSLYLIALKNMLVSINKMGKQIKLKQIVIHCDPIDFDQGFNLKYQLFKQEKWIIKIIEPWQLILFKKHTKKL